MAFSQQKMSVQEIAAAIHNSCLKIAMPHGAMVSAMDTMQTESENVTGARLTACIEIAALSHTHQWDDVDLDRAAKLAIATPSNNAPGSERTEKATAVFCSQIKAVARARVRGQFPVILNAIETAWDAEQENIKQAKEAKPPTEINTPLRKFVSRKYELILRACREINEGKTGLVIACAADVVAWAKRNDPDFDAERVAKRLKALANTLHAFYQDFPLAGIDTAKQAIASVKAEELIAARNGMISAGVGVLTPAPTPAPDTDTDDDLTTAPLDENEAETSEAEISAEPVEGVFDYNSLIDDMLNNPPSNGNHNPSMALAALTTE